MQTPWSRQTPEDRWVFPSQWSLTQTLCCPCPSRLQPWPFSGHPNAACWCSAQGSEASISKWGWGEEICANSDNSRPRRLCYQLRSPEWQWSHPQKIDDRRVSNGHHLRLQALNRNSEINDPLWVPQSTDRRNNTQRYFFPALHV